MAKALPDFQLTRISKHFNGVMANRDVSFQVEHNSIHGVVGENGAGKSTIMKIVYGLYQPDSGDIHVRGERQRISNPQKAIRLGIGMVHQHFMLVPTLTVWQNIVLGAEGGSIVRKSRLLPKLEELKSRFGFSVDLNRYVQDLCVGEQQQIEILKCLYRKAEILILDEPTAVLSPQETEALFNQLRELWKSGKTIVLITHKLKEILSLTQAVTVMRQGQVVETVLTEHLTELILAEKIVGRRPQPLNKIHSFKGEPVLQVDDLTLTRNGHSQLNNLSLTVRAGEVLGIAGVSGNGQQELVEILARVTKPNSGTITYLGHSLLQLSAEELKSRGLSLIPPDRLKEGLVPHFSVRENFLLGRHRNPKLTFGPFFRMQRIAEHSKQLVTTYDVRPSDDKVAVGGLSGGNQQKVIIGRETETAPKLLIAAYPTRGVDIGAIEFIHRLFLTLRSQGCAILLISSELDEILDLSDRILVLFNGRAMGETARSDATESRLGLWMTGASA